MVAAKALMEQSLAGVRRRGAREGGGVRENEEPSEKGQGAREDEDPSRKWEKFGHEEVFQGELIAMAKCYR